MDILGHNGLTSRRAFLQRAVGSGLAIATPSILAACGGSASTASTEPASSGPSSKNPLDVSPGSQIPSMSVNFGMAPFADASFYVIAITRGWFRDVGITIGPGQFGVHITPDNIVSKMVTGEVDIATFYGPGKIATLQNAPQLKMFGFSDVFIGTYLLAAPHSGVKTVAQLVKSGTPFTQAIKTVMSQVRGKPAAFNNSGEQRAFLESIFKLGGVTFSDIKLTVTDDSQILSLAQGGQIQFASANGAAQIVELLNQGWIPMVGVSDLIAALPPGDPRAVSGIGNEGPACSIDYYNKNRETCLRFLSVMFRTIDAIRAHPEILSDQVPYLTSASGVPTSVQSLQQTYKAIDPLYTFEEQAAFWKPSGPLSYATIYNPQIAAAQKGGILSSSHQYVAEDAIIGANAYNDLVALKQAYDALKTKASSPNSALASRAAAQYAHRNYLDAYRILKAAVA